MLDLVALLTVMGLGIDVVGAGVLAFPDFPMLRTRTKQGEIETAIHQMETGGLRPSDPAYDQVKETLEELYEIEIEEGIEGIRVGITSMKRNPDQRVFIYRTDEDSYTPDADLGWTHVRGVLASEVVESEMRFRRLGFSLLALGFSLQIAGTIL